MSIEQTTELLAVFADPTRVRALSLLAQREMSAAELLTVLGVAQSRMSTHLSRLKAAGLVQEQKRGNTAYLRLNTQDAPPDATALWTALQGTLDDALLAQDVAQADAVIRLRTRKSWPDGVAGEMEKHYSPGRTWEALARGLALLPTLGDVVDVGSGDGTVAQLLAAQCASLTLVDANPRMVEAARLRLQRVPHADVVQADAQELPWKTARFDVALLLNVLTDVEHPARVLSAVARVLRPGGTVLVTTLEAHEHLAVTTPFGHVTAGFSAARLKKMLTDTGFSVDHCAVTSREKRSPHFGVLTARATRTTPKGRTHAR